METTYRLGKTDADLGVLEGPGAGTGHVGTSLVPHECGQAEPTRIAARDASVRILVKLQEKISDCWRTLADAPPPCPSW